LIAESSFHFFTLLPDGHIRQPGRRMCPSAGSVTVERTSGQLLRAQHGEFHPRVVGIKSPVCLTPASRERQTFRDENLAPYSYDDFDLSLRVLGHEITKGFYTIRCESMPEWVGWVNERALQERG
jgi:hypothetical protein